jgi:hypothetical protein
MIHNATAAAPTTAPREEDPGDPRRYSEPAGPVLTQGLDERDDEGEKNAHLDTELAGILEESGSTGRSPLAKCKSRHCPGPRTELRHLEAVKQKAQHEHEEAVLGVDYVRDQQIDHDPGVEVDERSVGHARVERAEGRSQHY